jgi:RNase P subunit RPR2
MKLFSISKEETAIIKSKLSKKTISEITNIANRLNVKLRGNKKEMIHTIAEYFDCIRKWDIISGI